MSLQAYYARTLGIVLTLVGVLGFFVGTGTLIIFDVNLTHSIVHAVSGLLGIFAGFALAGEYAALFNRVFGLVYLAVAVFGLFGVGFVVGLLNINLADNVLHILIAIATTAVGFSGRE